MNQCLFLCRLFGIADDKEQDNRDRRALWDALAAKDVNFLSTDHCPFTCAQKEWKKTFDRLPYGMGSVELMLPLAYSEGILERHLTLSGLAERTAAAAARRYGLWPRKGGLLPGDYEIGRASCRERV